MYIRIPGGRGVAGGLLMAIGVAFLAGLDQIMLVFKSDDDVLSATTFLEGYLPAGPRRWTAEPTWKMPPEPTPAAPAAPAPPLDWRSRILAGWDDASRQAMQDLALQPVGGSGPLQVATVTQCPLVVLYWQDAGTPFAPIACATPQEVVQTRRWSPRPRTVEIQQPWLNVYDGTEQIVHLSFDPTLLQRAAGQDAAARQGTVTGATACTVHIDGTRLAFVPELSAIAGPLGEFMQAAELMPGDRIRFWASGALLLRAELQPIPPRRPQAPDGQPPWLRELCQRGEDADRMAAAGYLQEAAEQQRSLAAALPGGEPFLEAKLALSILYRTTLAGRKETPPQTRALEQGYVDVPDRILFALLTGRPEEAAKLTAQVPHARPLVLRNWQLQVGEPAAGMPPAWQEARRACPRAIAPRTVCYPAPAPWVAEGPVTP